MQLKLSSNWAATKESLLHFDSAVQLCQTNTSAKALSAIWQRQRSMAGFKSPCQPVNQSYVCRSWKKTVHEETKYHATLRLLVQKEESLSFCHCKTSLEAKQQLHWSHIQTANSRTMEYVWHAFGAHAHSQRELPKTCKAPMHLCSIWGLQIRREGVPSFSAWSLIKIWKTCSLVSWYPSRISESSTMRGPNLNFASNGRRMMSVPKRSPVVPESMGEFLMKIQQWCVKRCFIAQSCITGRSCITRMDGSFTMCFSFSKTVLHERFNVPSLAFQNLWSASPLSGTPGGVAERWTGSPIHLQIRQCWAERSFIA